MSRSQPILSSSVLSKLITQDTPLYAGIKSHQQQADMHSLQVTLFEFSLLYDVVVLFWIALTLFRYF
jgi:hypothetical protein